MNGNKEDGYRLGFQYRSEKELSYNDMLIEKLSDSSMSPVERIMSFLSLFLEE